MSEKDKATENSKVELTEDQLDNATGGRVDGHLKLDEGAPSQMLKIKLTDVLVSSYSVSGATSDSKAPQTLKRR